MGIKIINSREYREVCERVAFLEADLKEKELMLAEKMREMELKEDAIKALKKDNVKLCDTISDMQRQVAALTAERVVVAEPKEAPAEVKAEKPARKPRVTRKPKKA